MLAKSLSSSQPRPEPKHTGKQVKLIRTVLNRDLTRGD